MPRSASYSGSAHFDLDEFDTDSSRLSLWTDFGIDNETILRGRYEVGYAWVDYDDFATTRAAAATLYRSCGELGDTEFSLGWYWNDYPFGPLSIQENAASVSADGACDPALGVPFRPNGRRARDDQDRDGNGLRLALEHRHDFRTDDIEWLEDLVLRAGYAFDRYWAEGRDYDSMAHTFALIAIDRTVQIDRPIGCSVRS